ncbi:MAG: hypothetical protein HYV40_06450 [Candidatus Levybacteria bacterium]|nr:hypothetical protein [Candidatus Levybacteria bacterium]
MFINPLIFLVLVAAIFGLALVILFIINSYNHLIRKIEQAEEEKIHLHDSINAKASEMLQSAHEQNLKIIEDANKEAADILASAQVSKTEATTLLKEKIDQIVELQKKTTDSMNQQFAKNYQLALQKLQGEDIKSFEKISKDVENTVSTEMQEFTKTLKNETMDAHAIMQERIESEYAKVEEDIEKYKEEELNKIHDAVYPLLKNVISLVIGRSLSVQDHEELIIQAIQQAKTQMPEQAGIVKDTDFG